MHSASDGVHQPISLSAGSWWGVGKPSCCESEQTDVVSCRHVFLPSKHYPVYSLNVASMWLKLGRLYMGLENKAAGEKALKKVQWGFRSASPGPVPWEASGSRS